MHYFESLKSNGVRPAARPRGAPWRVALVANLQDAYDWEEDDPPDAGAEFDRAETVEAIAEAIEADGHWVHVCHGDATLPEALLNLRPHICFNIAEGVSGDAREAQVPALCELLELPYTASRVLTHALSLDKTRTKRLWDSVGLPTAPYQEFRTGEEPIRSDLRYPLIVKPAREGSGMGIDPRSVVEDEPQLRQRLRWAVDHYRQPILAEAFLSGREFTVGFLGGPTRGPRRRPWLYDSDGYHFFPILEIDSLRSVSPGVYGHDAKSIDVGAAGAPGYLCPAEIPAGLRRELVALTRRAAEALDCEDVARVDIRLGADGRPYLLEINTLPGLNPALSDLCIMAAAEGMPYHTLITEILYMAAGRYSLPFYPLEAATQVPVVHPQPYAPAAL